MPKKNVKHVLWVSRGILTINYADSRFDEIREGGSEIEFVTCRNGGSEVARILNKEFPICNIVFIKNEVC